MTWYAECKRRNWYCILGWDAISWYSDFLYTEWYNSLTPEQKHKLEEYKKKKQKEKEAELESTFACFVGFCASLSKNLWR